MKRLVAFLLLGAFGVASACAEKKVLGSWGKESRKHDRSFARLITPLSVCVENVKDLIADLNYAPS
jgi:hypothetical protein